ncbi:hypothetical protein [Curtobacterium sp. ZW137]|uniref:hypothetical protein n=1 Tax=Curtobacterium sp. ZW137 TaxID=2485104 RepID=UPI000F9BC79F|nr:hypothetical protein [Curtobacterium sp. ZW137]ROP64691.1 hypothetical protein EDF55_1341 [Curtobacterium sp. ZW137]
MAINIKIGANASDAIREAKRTGDAIDSIGDTLDDLARDSARSSREAARSLDDIPDAVRDAASDVDRQSRKLGTDLADGVDHGTEQAEDSVKALEKTFKQSVRDMARTDGKGGIGTNLSDDVRKGTHEAGESVSTFKDEAKANLSEVSSSFTGDMQSVVDLVQGTLGGVVADLGPIGLAAGALAAVGVGLIGAAIQSAGEDEEVFRQRVSDLATDLIETGRTGSASLAHIGDALKDMATTTDDGSTSLKDLRAAAERSGESYKDLAQAAAGHTDAIAKQIKRAEEQKTAWQQSGQAILEADDALGSSSNNRTKALDDYIAYLRQAQKASKDAATEQKNFAEAGGPALQQAAEATQNYADGVQDAYAQAGSSIEDYVKDGKFNLQAYTDNAKTQFEAIQSYQSNMVTLSQTLSSQALQYVESLGPDAAPAIAAFVKAPLAQQKATADVWDKLGSTSGTSYNNSLQGQLNASPASKTVNVTADLSAFNADMAYATRLREAHIRVYTDNMGGTRQGMGVP